MVRKEVLHWFRLQGCFGRIKNKMLNIPRAITDYIRTIDLSDITSGHVGITALCTLVITNYARMVTDGGLIETYAVLIGGFYLPLAPSISRAFAQTNGYTTVVITGTNIMMSDFLCRTLHPTMKTKVSPLLAQLAKGNNQPGCFSCFKCTDSRPCPNFLSKCYIYSWVILGAGLQLIAFFPTGTPWDSVHAKCAALMFAGVLLQCGLTMNMAYKIAGIDIE